MCNLDKQCTEAIKELPSISDCPVSWANDVIKMAREAACGKSVMCRDGLWQVDEIINDAVTGGGQSEDLELMREILDTMELLGCDMVHKVAAGVKASLSDYMDEWENHIKRKRCKALVCKAYYTVHVDPSKCTGEGSCIKVCPEGAIEGGEGLISVVNTDKCTRCGKCDAVCPKEAIIRAGAVKPKTPAQPVPVGSFEEAGQGRGRRRRK